MLETDVDECPTAVGPVLGPDEVRALMDVAENAAPTMPPAPATSPAPAKRPVPRPKSGLRARVRPEEQPAPPTEVVVDVRSLEPAIEIEHIEAEETHEIEVDVDGDDDGSKT